MTPQEEFSAAVQMLAETLSQLSLLLQTFQRLVLQPDLTVDRSVASVEEYEDFLRNLVDHGLGTRELNILNRKYAMHNSRRLTRDEVLSMRAGDFRMERYCGPSNIAKIRAVLEVAGYQHHLAEGWDLTGKCERFYRKWLPIVKLAHQKGVSVDRAEEWMTLNPEEPQDAVRN